MPLQVLQRWPSPGGIYEFFERHEAVFPAEPDGRVDGRTVAACGELSVVPAQSVRPKMALACIQTVRIGLTLPQFEQHYSRHFMHLEPCPQGGFINFHVAGAVRFPGAGLFAAFLHGFDAEMRGERIPASGADSLDDDIGIHQDDLPALHGLRPVFTDRTARASRTT